MARWTVHNFSQKGGQWMAAAAAAKNERFYKCYSSLNLTTLWWHLTIPNDSEDWRYRLQHVANETTLRGVECKEHVVLK